MQPASFRETVRTKALALGCCAAGFSAVEPRHDALQRFREMIAEGRHGEMQYLERGRCEREDPGLLLPGARSVLSVAVAGPGTTAGGGKGEGCFSAHATVPDYHRVLIGLLRHLLDFIRSEARTPVNGLACVDGAPVLEKAWAESAGIGRCGKNTLLIVPGAGSTLFLGELLLDLGIEPDEPLAWDPCGSCTACLDACPTGALAGPGRLDARRCISYLTIELKREFTAGEADMASPWLFGCDRCMEVCPHNSGRQVKPHPAFTPIGDIADLGAEKILELTGSTFGKLFAGTTVRRLGLNRLKRNARAVKGERSTGI
jgi:epoxyqueuosine reductase